MNPTQKPPPGDGRSPQPSRLDDLRSFVSAYVDPVPLTVGAVAGVVLRMFGRSIPVALVPIGVILGLQTAMGVQSWSAIRNKGVR